MARLLLLLLALAAGTTDAVSETETLGVATQALQLTQVVASKAVLYGHVYVEHLGLSDNGKAFVGALSQSLIDHCGRLLHTKLSKEGKVISGYYGASTQGFNLVAIEVLLPGLGIFLDTIFDAFELKRSHIIKILQYCKNVGMFPFHNEEKKKGKSASACLFASGVRRRACACFF
jgi:hypothetical protein